MNATEGITLDNKASEYWKDIYINQKELCMRCRNKIMNERKKDMTILEPLCYVGPEYEKDSKCKLMFIGKATWSNEKAQDTQDTRFAPFSEQTMKAKIKENSHFWNWMTQIAYELEIGGKLDSLPKEKQFNARCKAFRHVAYSNLVKCDLHKPGSEFSGDSDIIENCMNNAGWIYDEIRKLDPDNIIFFIGVNDDTLAKSLLSNRNLDEINDRVLIEEDVSFGESKNSKKLFRHLRGGDKRIIVTVHPRGTLLDQKLNLMDRIIEIIKTDYRDEMIPWEMPKGKKEMQTYFV